LRDVRPRHIEADIAKRNLRRRSRNRKRGQQKHHAHHSRKKSCHVTLRKKKSIRPAEGLNTSRVLSRKSAARIPIRRLIPVPTPRAAFSSASTYGWRYIGET